jgi:hypothetical protein
MREKDRCHAPHAKFVHCISVVLSRFSVSISALLYPFFHALFHSSVPATRERGEARVAPVTRERERRRREAAHARGFRGVEERDLRVPVRGRERVRADDGVNRVLEKPGTDRFFGREVDDLNGERAERRHVLDECWVLLGEMSGQSGRGRGRETGLAQERGDLEAGLEQLFDDVLPDGSCTPLLASSRTRGHDRDAPDAPAIATLWLRPAAYEDCPDMVLKLSEAGGVSPWLNRERGACGSGGSKSGCGAQEAESPRRRVLQDAKARSMHKRCPDLIRQ